MSPFRSCRLLVGVAGLVLGCSSQPNVRTFPVSGQVLRGGKPVAEAAVVFHPDREPDLAVHSPIGITDEQGRYRLTTWKPNDGAPAGSYRVTVRLRAKRLVGEEMVRDGPNLLPKKLATPESTPVRFEVKEGENDVPTITID